ncbi:MAG TPA: fused MFS/spermidine synthase [Candidatus Hydrogenedentes bacterium]|nr:fused MFS/spermidine synthase [Candidatus Hydrogenedentota bacterium]
MESRKERNDNTRRFYLLFAVLLLFFFISGACGLLYQVVWTRKLVLLFGTTAYAVSTVLSIFFLGLGLGSWWGGRLADRAMRPLRLYGVFEIIIGLWAVVFLGIVAYGENAVVALLQLSGGARSLGIALRALMALVVLFLPVALMGATLPLLSKFVSREPQVRGRRIGGLYTLNTLGAMTGCFLSGFLLLPHLGYTRTTLVGAVANLIIGTLAIVVSLYVERSTLKPSEDITGESRRPSTARWVILAFAVSGFCMLALEVLWTRLLAILFLGTTYAYTTMLTALLCGIAAGGAVASLIADRVRGHTALFGGMMILNGVSCILMLGWIAGMPATLAELQQAAGFHWDQTVRIMFALCFTALFLPTFCSGMTFPFAVKAVVAGRGSVGRDVGRLYSANTIGGVIGAALGGFVIIPLLGTHNGIVTMAALLILCGAGLMWICPETLRWGKTAAMIGGALLIVWAWSKAPADVSRSLNAGYVPSDHRVIHYCEGIEGTVAVSEPVEEASGSNRILWINRVQATASIERGVKMNRLQGVLPLLFDRDPRTVLFMCFGSGITCGTLALSGFERIDAVEISPDVIAAAPLFTADNLGVLGRPNLKVRIDDGRNFLLTTNERYDVITFEPMPLALAGVSTFYTQEYYKLCLNRLRPGGIVSQWVPLHSLSPELMKSLTYTFTCVFPEYAAFFVNADLFLIGSNQPLRLDYARAEQRLRQPLLKDALDKVGLRDLPEIFACFVLDKPAVDEYSSGGHCMTDDHPWAEFVAPKLVFERNVQDSLGALQLRAVNPLKIMDAARLAPDTAAAIQRRHEAHVHDFVGLQAYYGGLSIGSAAMDAFKVSLGLDPNDYTAQYYLKQIAEVQGKQFLRWQELSKAKAILEDALQFLPDDPELHVLLGDAYWDSGDPAAAKIHYQRHLDLGGHEIRARERTQHPGEKP